MAHNVDDVAAWLLDRLGPMRARRLQILVYYAQAWRLAEHDERLFADDLEARSDGPVVPRLADQCRDRDEARSWPTGDPARLAAPARDGLERVVRSYGGFSEGELSRIVRAEAPWRLARKGRRAGRRGGRVIDPATLADYYRRLRASPQVAVDVAVGSARLEGHEFSPEAVDRLREAAAGTRAVEEIIAELAPGAGRRDGAVRDDDRHLADKTDDRDEDPYCWPGTACLRNLLGLRDAAELDRVEHELVGVRTAGLTVSAVPGAYDRAHLLGFHLLLFQDVYDWAGRPRIGDITRGTSTFCPAPLITSRLDALFAELAARRLLTRVDDWDDFIVAFASLYGALNAIHPFREGNGRTQRAFLRQLAAHAGWTVAWERLERRANDGACHAYGVTGRPDALVKLLAPVIQPRT